MTGSDKSESDSFSAMVGADVMPLKGNNIFRSSKTKELTPGTILRRELAEGEKKKSFVSFDLESAISFIEPHAYLDFKRPGVQHGVYKNLRLGKYEIQSQLDLHRHTVEQARCALWKFLKDCENHNIRCAIVTHGKGEGRSQPAKLKSCVNHWLRQYENVLAFHSAHRKDGGVGSTYVLLKKSEIAKAKTAEKMHKKGYKS